MFCTNCGNNVNEGAQFCTYCGASFVNTAEPEYVEEVKEGKKGKGLKLIVILGALVISMALAATGVVLAWNNKLDNECDKLLTSIGSYQIPQYNEKKDSISLELKELGILNISDKKEIIETLKEMEEEVIDANSQLTEYETELKEMMENKDQYNLDESYKEYEELLDQCNSAVQSKDIEEIENLLNDTKEELKELIQKNEDYITEYLNEYKNIDMSLASLEEVETYNGGVEKIKELASQENYSEVKGILDDINDVVTQYIEPENYLDVSVQQVDVSAYPNIKLYTRITEQNTNEVPKNLDNTLFFIRKKDANAYYVKKVISKVTQLNEEESLNIDMVADISGSMYGRPLNEAKTIMSNFIGSVQFNAGDKVELTTFSTGVYIEEEFTGDKNILINKINNLETGDMTSLYDALYTSVVRVAAQPGAKCVIAFTDGLDNYSNCTSDEVITIAKRYHVPIFIIGIGSSSDYNAQNIATQTGGRYYSVNDINSMEEIYKEIYREQKEMYLIEFVDDNDGNVTDSVDIIVGYNSKTHGGNCNFTYTPNILLSVDSSAFYKDGPEAVVEAYMKAFDDAMTNRDFSYISDYLKKNSNIYNMQEKYVQRGIDESLVSYEIVDVTYNNSNESIVTTRETFYVQAKNEPLYLMTQQCKYIVVYENNEWKITDFAGSVEVLSRINQ